jgi:hypothetical protein
MLSQNVRGIGSVVISDFIAFLYSVDSTSNYKITIDLLLLKLP